MNRRTTTGWMTALAVSLTLALTGCSSDDAPPTPKPKATTDAAAADKAAVLDTFARYWADSVAIANSGKVPKNALESTATGPVREQDIAQFNQDVQHGTTRTGAPQFKDQTVTLQGDTALVVTCINEGDWPFILKDGSKLPNKSGWSQLGRELTKVDGKWLVTGYSPASTKETCP